MCIRDSPRPPPKDDPAKTAVKEALEALKALNALDPAARRTAFADLRRDIGESELSFAENVLDLIELDQIRREDEEHMKGFKAFLFLGNQKAHEKLRKRLAARREKMAEDADKSGQHAEESANPSDRSSALGDAFVDAYRTLELNEQKKVGVLLKYIRANDLVKLGTAEVDDEKMKEMKEKATAFVTSLNELEGDEKTTLLERLELFYPPRAEEADKAAVEKGTAALKDAFAEALSELEKPNSGSEELDNKRTEVLKELRLALGGPH